MIVGGAEGTVRQDWEPEGLIEVWTLLEDDMKKVRNKSGPTRLRFALLLRFSRWRPVPGVAQGGSGRSRLDLDLAIRAATVPSPRTPQEETTAASGRSAGSPSP